MMVLTKRVGDNPESHIPTLEVSTKQSCVFDVRAAAP